MSDATPDSPQPELPEPQDDTPTSLPGASMPSASGPQSPFLTSSSVATPGMGSGIGASSPDAEAEEKMRALTRKGFVGMGLASLAGLLGFGWLLGQKQDGGILWPLRRVLGVNEKLSEAYYRPGRLAPTFPVAQAGMPRANGKDGLEQDIDLTSWRMEVLGLPAAALKASGGKIVQTDKGPALSLSLDEIKTLPHQEMITEFKCIEGWSQVVHWGGVRFQDFVFKYWPELAQNPSLMPYVSLETPDRKYYVGLDMASALHPQTLLSYEMNGAPLEIGHGAPLRLAIPVKYGIKNIKRIGRITFTQTRPADYWAERGYDWYAGH